MLRACVQEESAQSPCCTEYRYDEENEDGRRCEETAAVVPIDEPGQHTQRGYEGDDLEDAPKDEGQAGERHAGCWCLVKAASRQEKFDLVVQQSGEAQFGASRCVPWYGAPGKCNATGEDAG